MTSLGDVESRLRCLSGAVRRLAGYELRSFASNKASPAGLKKLRGQFPDELVDTLAHFAGSQFRWTGPNAEQAGDIDIPDLPFFAAGWKGTAADARHNFDASKDEAFVEVDLQNGQVTGYLVRDVQGGYRYVVAKAGRESSGVTVGTTFAEYLHAALASIAHNYWAFPADSLASGVTVEASVRSTLDCFANVRQHAAKGALAAVECVSATPLQLDVLRARIVGEWKKAKDVAKALKVPVSDLHRELLREDLPKKDIAAALKKLPTPPKDIRQHLLAAAAADAYQEVTLRVTLPKKSDAISEHRAPLLLLDAPGAETLRTSLGDPERARFDSEWRPKANPWAHVAAEGQGTVTVCIALAAEQVPTGCTAGSSWTTLLPYPI